MRSAKMGSAKLNANANANGGANSGANGGANSGANGGANSGANSNSANDGIEEFSQPGERLKRILEEVGFNFSKRGAQKEFYYFLQAQMPEDFGIIAYPTVQSWFMASSPDIKKVSVIIDALHEHFSFVHEIDKIKFWWKAGGSMPFVESNIKNSTRDFHKSTNLHINDLIDRFECHHILRSSDAFLALPISFDQLNKADWVIAVDQLLPIYRSLKKEEGNGSGHGSGHDSGFSQKIEQAAKQAVSGLFDRLVARATDNKPDKREQRKQKNRNRFTGR